MEEERKKTTTIHSFCLLLLKVLHRVVTAAKTGVLASWEVSALVRSTLPAGAASTMNASGNQRAQISYTFSHCNTHKSLTVGFQLLSLYRNCGVILHGEWVQKGCSYCRCGYGMLHCFPQVFHSDCGKLLTIRDYNKSLAPFCFAFKPTHLRK